MIVDAVLTLATVFGAAVMLLLFVSAAVLWLDDRLDVLDDDAPDL